MRPESPAFMKMRDNVASLSTRNTRPVFMLIGDGDNKQRVRLRINSP